MQVNKHRILVDPVRQRTPATRMSSPTNSAIANTMTTSIPEKYKYIRTNYSSLLLLLIIITGWVTRDATFLNSTVKECLELPYICQFVIKTKVTDSILPLPRRCSCDMNYNTLFLFFAHQHKAAGVKTKQNVKQRLQRLLIRCSLC